MEATISIPNHFKQSWLQVPCHAFASQNKSVNVNRIIDPTVGSMIGSSFFALLSRKKKTFFEIRHKNTNKKNKS